MNLGELVQSLKKELQQFLEGRDIENHLRILLDHYLGVNRVDQLLKANEEVAGEKIKSINKAVEDLKTGKPIDYVINESVFWGFPFYVDHNVLIPRPETEELVLLLLDHEKEEKLSILDIGTGSGCIPIALKLERKDFEIDACDVSLGALQVAEKNAKLLKTDINLFELDFLTALPEQKYDVVVSNPPYVKEEELESLEGKVKEYEPVIALTPFGDPLKFYKRMVATARDILKPKGRFYWEIHEDLGAEVVNLLQQASFEQVELIEDMYGRNRLVRAVFTA